MEGYTGFGSGGRGEVDLIEKISNNILPGRQMVKAGFG
jgi:hypothetical protein